MTHLVHQQKPKHSLQIHACWWLEIKEIRKIDIDFSIYFKIVDISGLLQINQSKKSIVFWCFCSVVAESVSYHIVLESIVIPASPLTSLLVVTTFSSEKKKKMLKIIAVISALGYWYTLTRKNMITVFCLNGLGKDQMIWINLERFEKIWHN